VASPIALAIGGDSFMNPGHSPTASKQHVVAAEQKLARGPQRQHRTTAEARVVHGAHEPVGTGRGRRLGDQLATIADDHDQFVDAEVEQILDVALHQRLAAQFDQRLGRLFPVVSEQPAADSGGEHDGLHRAIPQTNA